MHEEKYKRVDLRFILLAKYDKFDEENLKNIETILWRFYSIHNELRDIFTIEKGDEAETFDFINDYYLFNINISCI